MLRVAGKSFLSLDVLFVLLSFLFHFGQLLITTLNINDLYSHLSVMSITGAESYQQAVYFAIYAHFFLVVGLILSSPYSSAKLKSAEDESAVLKRIKMTALIILSISLVPLIYLDFLKIQATQQNGYMSTYETYSSGPNKYLGLIAQFARPAVSILLISLKSNQRKALSLFLASSLYFAFVMISGDRGTNIIYIITNIYIYFRIIKKIKLYIIFLSVVSAYFFLGFISAISVLRDTANISYEGLSDTYKLRASVGIIYSVLREFGSTLKTLVYSIEFTKGFSDYNYGLTYVLSWINLAPKVPDELNNALINSFTFVKSFPASYQESLGGSYLGELYYNFGYLGCFFALVAGKFVGGLSRTLDEAIACKNWIIVVIIIILFPNVLLWVRGYFVEMLFKAFWLGAFFWVANSELRRASRVV